MTKKDFPSWMTLKETIHERNALPCFTRGQVWWAHIGENVGVEVNGKGRGFYRPVLIARKLSRYNFIAIPLTSQFHQGSWYEHFVFQGRDEYAMLAQVRTLSAARLCNRMGEVSECDFRQIIAAFKKLFG